MMRNYFIFNSLMSLLLLLLLLLQKSLQRVKHFSATSKFKLVQKLLFSLPITKVFQKLKN